MATSGRNPTPRRPTPTEVAAAEGGGVPWRDGLPDGLRPAAGGAGVAGGDARRGGRVGAAKPERAERALPSRRPGPVVRGTAAGGRLTRPNPVLADPRPQDR